jgi:hypothetical protein
VRRSPDFTVIPLSAKQGEIKKIEIEQILSRILGLFYGFVGFKWGTH